MNDEELALLEERLRSIVVAANLEWLLPEVDATIAEGMTFPKAVEEEYGDFTVLDDEAERPTTRRRPRRRQVRVAYRPLTRRERVHVLIDAIRQVGVDGPRTEQATLSRLRAIQDGPPIPTIDFLPDEDDTSASATRIAFAERDERMAAADQLLRLLNELQAEADQ
jgi:hypothetical protein